MLTEIFQMDIREGTNSLGSSQDHPLSSSVLSQEPTFPSRLLGDVTDKENIHGWGG